MTCREHSRPALRKASRGGPQPSRRGAEEKNIVKAVSSVQSGSGLKLDEAATTEMRPMLGR